jgi:hypothetical protein
MQRKTTKKSQENTSRHHPTERMLPASGSVGSGQLVTIRSDGDGSDRMDGSAVTSFHLMAEFNPHNHWWLIISIS